MTNDNDTFSGTWQFTYWYPSNKQPDTEEPSQYTGTFHKSDKQWVYQSEPNAEGAYMFVRMTLDNDLITGTWYENTSPSGEFEGSTYSGAFQALIDKAGTKVEGKWAGIGQDNGIRKIYTGRLEFVRAG